MKVSVNFLLLGVLLQGGFLTSFANTGSATVSDSIRGGPISDLGDGTTPLQPQGSQSGSSHGFGSRLLESLLPKVGKLAGRLIAKRLQKRLYSPKGEEEPPDRSRRSLRNPLGDGFSSGGVPFQTGALLTSFAAANPAREPDSNKGGSTSNLGDVEIPQPPQGTQSGSSQGFGSRLFGSLFPIVGKLGGRMITNRLRPTGEGDSQVQTERSLPNPPAIGVPSRGNVLTLPATTTLATISAPGRSTSDLSDLTPSLPQPRGSKADSYHGFGSRLLESLLPKIGKLAGSIIAKRLRKRLYAPKEVEGPQARAGPSLRFPSRSTDFQTSTSIPTYQSDTRSSHTATMTDSSGANLHLPSPINDPMPVSDQAKPNTMTVSAARDLKCRIIPEVVSEITRNPQPMACRERLCPEGDTCRVVQGVPVCCPSTATGQTVQTKGTRFRWNRAG